MAEQKVAVLGISGSLRQGSYNTAALRAAQELAPAELSLELATLESTELFDEDVEAKGYPPGIARLRELAAKADAILFATPEYNYSVTGVLKNAIDWLSRPPRVGPLWGKPAGVIGASQAMQGTARAQMHLRQILYYNAMPVLPTGEVLIGRAQDKFDAEGRLTDEATRDFLRDYLEKFATWVRQQA